MRKLFLKTFDYIDLLKGLSDAYLEWFMSILVDKWTTKSHILGA